jgi:ribosomal protein S18 acetylase RimI-like enzyme
MQELCDATEAAIEDGGGFGWLKIPSRKVLEDYWKGVLLIPERELIVGRIDGVIASSCQLVRPARNNEAQNFSFQLTTFFVTPWARGHGLAPMMLDEAEAFARGSGFSMISLDVRATQESAIRRYEAAGYVRFGTHPRYALVNGEYIPGYFYYKDIK